MIIVSKTSIDLDSLTARATDSENGINSETKTTDLSTSVAASSKKGLKFWLIFVSMCLCLFLSALELYSVSTALPTIAHELRASQFVWVGSAYALSSTAFLPMSGDIAQAFGRRHAILLTIGLFALGSGICGGASSMNMLIAGRTIQGLGGGGIQSVTSIILADLVTLQERGLYAGLFWLTWCLAASIGPVVGGSLAAQDQWRWLFYLNLPVSFVALLSVVFFLDLPTPPGGYRDKVRRMDWMGNFLVIGSTTACAIALTWGGITAPWNSATVLVPFGVGLVGFVGFIVYEMTLATQPLIPLALLTNSTTISGYVQTFCLGIATLAILYFFPVYFQACKGASPMSSGIYTLSVCTFAPAAIFTGMSVKMTGRYRPQMWVAWVVVLVTMGLLIASTSDGSDMEVGTSVGYLVLLGLSIGTLSAASMYPILAPLSVTQNASAVAWMWFLRSFAGVWGITIGSTVLQNELSNILLAQGSTVPVESLYALIPELAGLPPDSRNELQVAFARSLAVLWQVVAGVCAIGGVASLFMRGIALSRVLDPTWAARHAHAHAPRADKMNVKSERNLLDVEAAVAAEVTVPEVEKLDGISAGASSSPQVEVLHVVSAIA